MTDDRLDEQTERLIERFSEIMRTYRSDDYTLDKNQRHIARTALRSRIRELMREARSEGAGLPFKTEAEHVR